MALSAIDTRQAAATVAGEKTTSVSLPAPAPTPAPPPADPGVVENCPVIRADRILLRSASRGVTRVVWF